MRKEIVKYDIHFKRTVVSLLEKGEIKSIEQARRIFRIGGRSTVTKWIRKFGNENTIPKIKMRRLIDEVDSIENKELYEKVLIHLSSME